MNIKKIVRQVIKETIRDPRNLQMGLNSEIYRFVDNYAPKIFKALQSIKKAQDYNNDYDYHYYIDYCFEIHDLQRKIGWVGLQYNMMYILFDNTISENDNSHYVKSTENYAGSDDKAGRKGSVIVFSPKYCVNLSYNQLKQIFIHELTHMLDWADYRSDRKQKSKRLDAMNARDTIRTTMYLFNPSEIEARIQEATEAFRQTGDAHEAFDVARIKDMEDYMDNFIKYIPSREEFRYIAWFFKVRIDKQDMYTVQKIIYQKMINILNYMAHKLMKCIEEVKAEQ